MGVDTSSTTTASKRSPTNSAAERVLVVERERSGNARWRNRHAELVAHRVQHASQPRIACAWPPDRDREPPARPEDAPDLADRAGGIEREHEALAAEHDVVRARPADRCGRGRARRCSRCRARATRHAPPRSTSSPPRRRTAPRGRRGRRASPPPARGPRDRRPTRARGRRVAAPTARASAFVSRSARAST